MSKVYRFLGYKFVFKFNYVVEKTVNWFWNDKKISNGKNYVYSVLSRVKKIFANENLIVKNIFTNNPLGFRLLFFSLKISWSNY